MWIAVCMTYGAQMSVLTLVPTILMAQDYSRPSAGR
ncbi:exported hypothetical protein [Cupriavidus taiwanensis]|nr:exported hypothetical protein [Cupriavidus taiwanensis]SOY52789.1 exported hypothetical protein [Cupriavidus taiwanensis]SOZ80511.1 exported hypothetical protein [Cupriavidus taiwanensis]SOZ81670.1 exported hypothetical protein [Cupriavidus taiwanensis]SPD44821.1 protein of unknown function [Cupriavidus taiwanensis]